ncbi:MAG: hypothetical protein SFY70_05400 [Bacteroidia bacterium]|nr:hypothetical protein [Bacteroidia bacterium]
MPDTPFRFVVLWFDRHDNAFQLTELEEALTARQFIPRPDDYLAAGADEDNVQALDEKGNPVTLRLKVVQVDSVVIDPFTDEVTLTCLELQERLLEIEN